MNYFDYAILAIFVLFLLLGLYRGFIKTVLSLISWAISFLLIYLFAKTLAGALMNIGFIGDFFRDYVPKLFPVGDPATYEVIINEAGDKVLKESGQLVTDVLTNLMFPTFMHGMFLPYFTVGTTLADALVNAVSDYALMMLSSIIIIVVVSIAMRIVSSLVANIVRKGHLSMINRSIGGILYGVVAVFVICLAMVAIDLMRNFSFMNVVIQYRDAGIISSWLAKNNPIMLLLQFAK